MAIAFTLSFLSFLIQKCISSFENFSPNEQSPLDKPVTNGLQNNAQVLNGFNIGMSKNEHSVTAFNASDDSLETKKSKRALQHRRRRRRRRNVDYSFDSYSGSCSESEESGEDASDDSDLSEGGGEGEANDRMSDESDDVYVESESDDENGNTGSFVKTVFSVPHAKRPESDILAKSADKLAGSYMGFIKQGSKAGVFGQNGLSVGKLFRPDLISDVSDAETGKSNVLVCTGGDFVGFVGERDMARACGKGLREVGKGKSASPHSPCALLLVVANSYSSLEL